MKDNVEGPQKIKTRTALWPSTSTSGYLSKKTQNTNSEEYMHTYVHDSVIYKSKVMETTQVPINK